MIKENSVGGGDGREGVKPHLRYFETITTFVFLKMFVQLFDFFNYVRKKKAAQAIKSGVSNSMR